MKPKRKIVALFFLLAAIGIFVSAGFVLASESESLRPSFWQTFKTGLHRLFIIKPLPEFEFELGIAEEQSLAFVNLAKSGKLKDKDIENYEKQLGRIESAVKKNDVFEGYIYERILEIFLNQYKSFLKINSFNFASAIEGRFIGILSRLAQIDENFAVQANNIFNNSDSPSNELLNAFIIGRVAAAPAELLPNLASLKQERLIRFLILAKDFDAENLKNILLESGQVSFAEWLELIDEARESLDEEFDRSKLALIRQTLFESFFIEISESEVDGNLELAAAINQEFTSLTASKKYKSDKQIEELAERSEFNLEQSKNLKQLGNLGASLNQSILAFALGRLAVQKLYLSNIDLGGELKILRQRFDNISADKKEAFSKKAGELESLLVSKEAGKRLPEIKKMLIEFELGRFE